MQFDQFLDIIETRTVENPDIFNLKEIDFRTVKKGVKKTGYDVLSYGL